MDGYAMYAWPAVGCKGSSLYDAANLHLFVMTLHRLLRLRPLSCPLRARARSKNRDPK